MNTKATSSEAPKTDLDIHDPELATCVYDTYRELREECPVARTENHGGHWVFTRYDDIHEAVRDHETYSSEGINVPDTGIGQQGKFIPLQLDPPEHTAYRKLLTPLFSPTRMRAMEGEIRELAKSLVDDLAGRDRCDFVEDFAAPLPTRVFLGLLGWPQDDADQLQEWSDTMVHGIPGATDEENVQARMEAGGAVYGYFGKMLAERMENPGAHDDITDVLLAGDVDGRKVTMDEMLNICAILMIAGLDTVKGALAHSIIYFAENPAARAELGSDPSIIDTAVEEMLRYESAVAPSRKVRQNVTVGGFELSEGDLVLLPYAAANRDPEKFTDPDEVDLRRDPNPHLAFGGGVHRCIGAHLARLELAIAFEELHRRIPDYRLDPAAPPKQHLSQVKGVSELPLILHESI